MKFILGIKQWATDPDVIKLQKREGLKDLKEVEYYFLNRMADSIQSLGKKVFGWDEIAYAGLDNSSSSVMWWRHDKEKQLKDLLKMDYPLILCPRIPLYFDFDQHESHTYGRRWGGFCSLEKIYAFPSNEFLGALTNKENIKGIQANIWTERIKDNKRLDYMTYPRLTAMAETAWTADQTKDYDGFLKRLKNMYAIFEEQGIYYFNTFNPESTPEPEGHRK